MTIIAIAIFALCLGSFLNVCIYRIPLKLSVAEPKRSFCPSCERQLTWSENIPVLSWLIQGAKCRGCKKPISGQYPLVELLTSLAGVGTYIKFGLNPTSIILFSLTVTLITISFIDMKHKIIPNVISFPGMTFGLCLGIVSQYTTFLQPPLTTGALDSLFGFFAGGGFFFVIGYVYYLVTKNEGLGMGDIKLLGMTGAILGIDSIIPTIFAGSLFGAVFGVLMILIQGGGRKTEIPFGPWLSLGALLYIYVDVKLFHII